MRVPQTFVITNLWVFTSFVIKCIWVGVKLEHQPNHVINKCTRTGFYFFKSKQFTDIGVSSLKSTNMFNEQI